MICYKTAYFGEKILRKLKTKTSVAQRKWCVVIVHEVSRGAGRELDGKDLWNG